MGLGVGFDEESYDFVVNWFKLHKYASSSTLAINYHRLGRKKATTKQKRCFSYVLRKLNSQNIIKKYNGNTFMRIDGK